MNSLKTKLALILECESFLSSFIMDLRKLLCMKSKQISLF